MMARVPGQRGSGFTLLELVLVLVILAAIGLVAARVLGGSVEALSVTRELTETQMEAGAALDRMARDIRGARQVEECGDGVLRVETRRGDARHYDVSGGRLRLDGVTLAGTREDPVAGFACDPEGRVDRLYALELETGSGYVAQTHAYHRR